MKSAKGGESTDSVLLIVFDKSNKKGKKMKTRIFVFVVMIVALLIPSVASAAGGFDEFGYNYQARIFNGKADGIDRVLDGMVWDDPAYANDRLVMKWSQAWDDAKFNAQPWTCDAWENNEWNGMVPGGSGEVWHYKIVWVGAALDASPCWKEGGYPIWGQFEVIMSHGTFEGQHFWDVRANPAGYGS